MELSRLQIIRKRKFTLLLSDYRTQKEAAEALGLSVSQVSDYKKGKKGLGEGLCESIERLAKRPAGYLSTDTNTSNSDVQSTSIVDSVASSGNVAPRSPTVQGYCPLMGWADAVDWESTLSNPNKLKSWLLTDKEHSENTFCLEVMDNSMTNKLNVRPSYFEGDAIFIDPNKKNEATHKSVILAKLSGDDIPDEHRMVFRQLIIQGATSYLKPINDSYPIINDPFTVEGVVIGGTY